MVITQATDYGEKRAAEAFELKDASAAGGGREADHGRAAPPQRRSGAEPCVTFPLDCAASSWQFGFMSFRVCRL